ncbi:MAG: hypothetical protein JWL95_2321 [Gemmatimonadetes bacterium]|nr:hypothetical protein [Gemmatimonadota bacterium]
MRTATIAILGSPFACWAMYGCLAILGISATPAAVAAVAWGVFWLAVAHFGRYARRLRRGRTKRGRGAPASRGLWMGALLGSFFLPIPIVLLTLLVDRFHVASAAVILPLFAMLAMPAPTALWWMALWPSTTDDEVIMHPIGWRRYTPHAPSVLIPPRGGPKPGV